MLQRHWQESDYISFSAIAHGMAWQMYLKCTLCDLEII
jgi:hypothetical protein